MTRIAIGTRPLLTFIAAFVVLFLSISTNTFRRTLDEIRSSGSLIVGVDIPYGVMEFYGEDGKPADIDISKEIARTLGVEAEFNAMSFDDLFDAIHDDRVDIVLSAVTITPERQQTLLFSVPYMSANTMVAVADTNQTINSLDDLTGRRLGVIAGTLGESLAKEDARLQNVEVVAYDNNDNRIADLVAGRIDAAIVHFLIKTDLPIRLIGDPLRQNFYGAVVSPSSQDLIAEANKVFREMKRNGGLEEIKSRYTN